MGCCWWAVAWQANAKYNEMHTLETTHQHPPRRAASWQWCWHVLEAQESWEWLSDSRKVARAARGQSTTAPSQGPPPPPFLGICWPPVWSHQLPGIAAAPKANWAWVLALWWAVALLRTPRKWFPSRRYSQYTRKRFEWFPLHTRALHPLCPRPLRMREAPSELPFLIWSPSTDGPMWSLSPGQSHRGGWSSGRLDVWEAIIRALCTAAARRSPPATQRHKAWLPGSIVSLTSWRLTPALSFLQFQGPQGRAVPQKFPCG